MMLRRLQYQHCFARQSIMLASKVFIEKSEEVLRKGMKESYGFSYYFIGSYLAPWLKRLPFHYGAWLILRIFNILNTLSWIYMPIKSVLLRPKDFQILTEGTHTIILIIVLTLNVFYMQFHKEELTRIFRSVGEGLFEYGDTLDEETKQLLNKIEENTTTKRKMLSKIFIFIMIAISAAHMTIRPLADMLTDDRMYKSDDPDGVTHRLPSELWYPFKLHNSVTRTTLAYIHLGSLLFWGFNVATSTVVTFINYAQILCGEYQKLCVTTRRFIERAKAIFHENHKDKSFQNYKNDIIFEGCLRSALKDSVKHQQKLMIFAEDLKEVYYFIVLTYLLGITALLCFGGVLFTKKDSPLGTLLLYLCFLIGELYLWFMFCLYGGKISDLSAQVGEEVYNSDWIEYASMIKTDILIMQVSSAMPRGITAGGFNNIQLTTFSDVVSSAFSYFNIVNAVQK